MKVSNITPLSYQTNFKAEKETPPQYAQSTNRTEWPVSAPDFSVKVPVKYTKTGTTKFCNGLTLHSYKLSNGYRVSVIPMENSPAVVKTYVNVGSMNESDNIKGISHFLEHMAFNGTIGNDGYIKLDTGDSFKKIDKMGGWTNASTNYALTDYVNSTPMLEDKDIEEQIKILAAMTENLALTDKMIEKEKGPVSSEINMILDDPSTIAMDQTVRTLYNIKSSADELVGGSVNHIQNLTRQDVKDYYDKYYTPENTNIVVTGDVNPDEVIALISKNFRSKKASQNIKRNTLVPISSTVRKDFVTDKAKSATIMVGLAGHKPNNTKECVIYDLLAEYISSTKFGMRQKMEDLNSYFCVADEKISTDVKTPKMLYFAIDTSEENSEKTLKVLYDKLYKMQAPDKKTLEAIKQKFKTGYIDGLDYSSSVNSLVGYGISDNKLDYALNYTEILDSITTDDIQEYINKYIKLDKAAITVIHPQNNTKTKEISFNGKSTRKPVNTDNIERVQLKNNYDIAFYKTKNDNIRLNLSLNYDIPENTKAGVTDLYNIMLDNGTKNSTEDNFNLFLEENNICLYKGCSPSALHFTISSNTENLSKAITALKENLYQPNLTEDSLNKAKKQLRDSLSRAIQTSFDIYTDSESAVNPVYTSSENIKNNIDSITLDDIKNYHKYILENSSAVVAANQPNDDVKNCILKEFDNFENVKPNIYQLPKYYQKNDNVKVLTEDRTVSQADISEVFKYKFEDTLENRVKNSLVTTLLSSSSIGLFDNLREKEHLAYSVSADCIRHGDCNEIICNILTTTDNKETGEKSFENVQKSIDGFNRQIGMLVNSKYTDEDLESAKRVLKASFLNNEGVSSKVESLEDSMLSKYGVDFDNKLFDTIDSISREDIDNYAKQIFSQKPVYSIVASKDTLDANKTYLENLKQ